MLLDFNKLTNKIQSNEKTDKTVVVEFYSKVDAEMVLLGNESRLPGEFRAFGKSGEKFEKTEGSQTTLYFCLGELDKEESKAWGVQKAMGTLYEHISTYNNCSRIRFVAFDHVHSAYFGFIIASYKYDFLLKPKEDETKISLHLEVPKEFEEIAEVARAQNIARFLGDTPSNLCTPTTFCEYAAQIFDGVENVELNVLEEEQCRELGMNVMLSVGNGSAERSKLLTIKYTGNSNVNNHKVAMVGKGVVFDTGGISLKPSLNMHEMKYDMMGASTLLMSFYLAALQKLPINATCTIPLVENMPGSKATNPGDIFKAMNGKSVEVGNTDAEGRLILGDAMCYAQLKYGLKPEFLLDAATLTGAMVVALGSVYSGYMTNSDELHEKISTAANLSDEMLWRLPMSKYYADQLKSNVADFNNIGDRTAGSIVAGEFLKHFVENDVKWGHFDIAGLMCNGVLKEIYGKGATARPLHTFYELLKVLSRNE
ncbi:AMPL [Enterospora canceri]|uniref:leucyl aminopeptidase n=1 Tax=Enterospora canceri TaxID=1081671 RepID=A0A1Y1S6U9_9MICR|nr:AMPL [Enterospora canceri]